jgi:hypothetical protein
MFITIFSRVDKVLDEDEELTNDFLKAHFIGRITRIAQYLEEFEEDFNYYMKEVSTRKYENDFEEDLYAC